MTTKIKTIKNKNNRISKTIYSIRKDIEKTGRSNIDGSLLFKFLSITQRNQPFEEMTINNEDNERINNGEHDETNSSISEIDDLEETTDLNEENSETNQEDFDQLNIPTFCRVKKTSEFSIKLNFKSE